MNWTANIIMIMMNDDDDDDDDDGSNDIVIGIRRQAIGVFDRPMNDVTKDPR